MSAPASFPPPPAPSSRASGIAAVAGAVLLVLCLLAGRVAPRQGLLSYLFAFLFFTGLSAGSLALLLVHVLTGGAWGDALRTPLLAAARVLPLQAVLALPILVGMRVLYPWTMPALLAHDTVLRAQGWYLDEGFFVARTVVCFALWLAVLAVLLRWLAQPARAAALPRLAAAGLIVYALSTLVLATDWVMSLVPQWHSSTFGMMVATGWMLGAAALAVLRSTSRGAPAEQAPRTLRDLGNLLLMFVLAWAYLAFMQYLTIWIADQPAETSWYISRTLTTWRWLAWFLIAFHFAVPFAVLLSRQAKQHRTWLAAIAAMLLAAQLADALWLVVPDSRTTGFSLRWTDLLAPAGIGALWLSLYFRGLRLAPRGALAQEAAGVPLGSVHG
ncbi:MAG: hypothetical protein WA747_03990 [Steroidobacteraceae bacterium]